MQKEPNSESESNKAAPALNAFEKALLDLEKKRAVIIALKPYHDSVAEILRSFPALGAALRVTDLAVWLDLCVDSLAEVQPLLAAIVRARHRPHGRRDYPDESPPRVTYYYGTDPGWQIIANVRINSGSTACRLEKVEDKLVPVYKIVCAGKAVAA